MLSLFIDITAPQIEAMEYQLFMHPFHLPTLWFVKDLPLCLVRMFIVLIVNQKFRHFNRTVWSTVNFLLTTIKHIPCDIGNTFSHI